MSADKDMLDVLRSMVGEVVYIEWKNEEDDWNYFRVLDVIEKDNMVHLKGENDPETNSRHKGDDFYVNVDEIVFIQKQEHRLDLLSGR